MILTLIAAASITKLVIDFGIFLAAVTTTLVALGAMLKAANATGLGRPIKWVWRHLASDPLNVWFEVQMNKVLDVRLKPFAEAQDAIKKEVTLNSGSSLKDAVLRIETQLAKCPEMGGSV